MLGTGAGKGLSVVVIEIEDEPTDRVLTAEAEIEIGDRIRATGGRTQVPPRARRHLLIRLHASPIPYLGIGLLEPGAGPPGPSHGALSCVPSAIGRDSDFHMCSLPSSAPVGHRPPPLVVSHGRSVRSRLTELSQARKDGRSPAVRVLFSSAGTLFPNRSAGGRPIEERGRDVRGGWSEQRTAPDGT